MTLSTDERRSLGVIATLLVLAAAARWLERPQPLLEDVPALDIAGLEERSRSARPQSAGGSAVGAAGNAGGAGGAGGRGAGGAGSRATASGQTGGVATGRLDPNTASAADLERLPGVGPSLAARIIEERERRPFASVEDMRRVRGIGAALATDLADLVTLPTTSQRQDPSPVTESTAVKTARDRAPANVSGERSDINDISSTDLQKVPGVGPVLAARLIARRDSIRGFRNWEQVDSVAGVGPAMLARLQQHLVIRR